MNSDLVVARLRAFLLWLACGLFAGTVVELWLTEHTESPVQLLPFLLCGIGLIATLVVIFRPGRASLQALRAIMVVAVVGGAFGVFQHLEHNLEFAREVNAAAADAAPLWTALTGANPPLAPGVLAVAALVALAASYAHPALAKARAAISGMAAAS
jgi:hypothetical protein